MAGLKLDTGVLGNEVSVGAANPVPVTSSGTGAASDQVQGNAANGVSDTGNPVKIGGIASSVRAPVTAGQRVNARFGLGGEFIIGMGDAAGFADGGNAVTVPFSIDGIARPLSVVPSNWNGTAMAYQRGDTGGTWSLSKGAATVATGQVAVGTSATQVVPARLGRSAVTIVSTSAVVFYVGATGVTAATGQYVAAAAGASITIPTSAAVFAVGASALTVSYLETY